MLDEEGRTRLKLKVCVCVCVDKHTLGSLFRMKCEFCLSVYSDADCPVSWHRWKIRSGGEPKGTRRETKRGRATHVSSNGLTAGVCCRCGILACTPSKRKILGVFVSFWICVSSLSMSLHLGNEVFDVYKAPLQGDHNHLFIRQGTGLQGQAVFKTKLTFR